MTKFFTWSKGDRRCMAENEALRNGALTAESITLTGVSFNNNNRNLRNVSIHFYLTIKKAKDRHHPSPDCLNCGCGLTW